MTSHFDLLAGSGLSETGKPHGDIHAELAAGMLNYARHAAGPDLRPVLRKYETHMVYCVRSQSQTCLRHLEETEGRVTYREQQEVIIRNLGGFNSQHLAMIMKAIAKGQVLGRYGFGAERYVYGRMFRATLMDHWEYDDVKAIWQAVSRDCLPSRSEIMGKVLQAGGLTLAGESIPFPLKKSEHDAEQLAARRRKDDQSNSETYEALRQRAMKEGVPLWTAHQRGKSMLGTELSSEGMADKIVVDWDGERRYDPLSALTDVARLHGLCVASLQNLSKDHRHNWGRMTWDECLHSGDFRGFCESHPEAAASARRIWERNNPKMKSVKGKDVIDTFIEVGRGHGLGAIDYGHDLKILESVRADPAYQLATWDDAMKVPMLRAFCDRHPKVAAEAARRIMESHTVSAEEETTTGYDPLESYVAAQEPLRDAAPCDLHYATDGERVMRMSSLTPSDQATPPDEGHFVLLSGFRYGCVYRDSPFSQTLDLKVPGVVLADRVDYLDLVKVADGKLVEGYRYHGLSRVGGDVFRYQRIEECNHSG